MKNVLRMSPAVVALLALAALPVPAAGQSFVDRTDVFTVEIPVQVVRDNTPVRGLSAADFEVYEGRKKLPIQSFEVVELGTAQAPAAATPAAIPVSARRHLLFLFDLSYSEPRSIVKAREAAQGILPRLDPSDLVGVATWSAARGPQLVLGFTSDKRQVERALTALGLPELVDRNPDPLRLVASEFRQELTTKAGGRALAREAIDQLVLEDLEENMRASLRSDAEAKRGQLTAFTRSLSDFARRLSAVAGRKQVLYLSEGFDSSILLGTTDQARQDEMREASISGEYWKVDSTERMGSTEAANDLETLFETLRRSDCVIQSVDIGGLRAAGSLANERPVGQDGLFLMARETGGEMVRNFNDLEEALGRVLDRTAVTYVLTVAPEFGKRDGGFRKLRVEVKGAQRGTQVSHRAGYFAPRPAGEQNPLELTLATASSLLGEEGGAFPVSLWAAPFRLPGTPAAYVPVLLEVDGRGLVAKAASGTLPAEIFVYALGANGEVQDYFNQTVALDLAKVGAALGGSGLKFFGHLDLPPGRYTLRTLVRNGSDGRLSLAVQPLVVPGAEEPLLLPPLFPETPGRWVMVREVPRGAPRDVPYPFLLAEQPFIPASLPALEAGKEVPAVVFAYRPGGGAELAPELTVLSPDGKEVGKGEIQLAAREAGSASAPDRFRATVKLPTLPAGRYLLRLKVTDGAGGVHTSQAPIRLGGGGQG